METVCFRDRSVFRWSHTLAALALAALALLAPPSLSAAQEDPSQVLQSAEQGDVFRQMIQRSYAAELERRKHPTVETEADRQRAYEEYRRRDRFQAAYDRYRADEAATDNRRLQCEHQCDAGFTAKFQQCLDHNSSAPGICSLEAGQCTSGCEANYKADMAALKSRLDAARIQP